MKIKSSAPGRICLFGEHQDYMGFSVIAAAIDLRISIEGTVVDGNEVTLDLLDLKKNLTFSLKNIIYTRERDYFKSTIQVLKNKKLFKEKKIKARVQGNIPIQSGTSSSSAMVVAWTGFLLQCGDDGEKNTHSPEEIAEYAYLAEVEEFGESGGRMDQYTSALGGIVHIDFNHKSKITPLPIHMKEFVLGDSLQPKDTQKTLKRIRTGQEMGIEELKKYLHCQDKMHIHHTDAEPYFDRISSSYQPYLRAVLKNRQITSLAKEELLKKSADLTKLAALMNSHHEVLRDELKLSTTKIENMIEQSMKAGALAAKINGSGEGGCMFAFCPGKQQAVTEAIKHAGGKPYIINIGKGLDVKIIDRRAN
ncbi:MAG: GHMP kinase [Candidatus Aminicenantes bacterium]|nr:GHMP kinase [Candidatus Aminicenantes bacterium]